MDFRNNIAAQGSRGLRNNNPMNLRPSGFTYQHQVGLDEANHAIFDDVIYGVRAGTLDLYTKYFVDDLKTFEDIVHKFAPYSDGNNEAAYVQSLQDSTGITGDINLNASNIQSIIKAFINEEIGEQYGNMISIADIVKGINAANKTGLTIAGSSGVFLLVVAIVIAIAIMKKKDR
jgi:hypothetical protein